MDKFLKNLALLAALGLAVYIMAPDMTSQVCGLYNALGILPLVLVVILFSALPRRGRRRR